MVSRRSSDPIMTGCSERYCNVWTKPKGRTESLACSDRTLDSATRVSHLHGSETAADAHLTPLVARYCVTCLSSPLLVLTIYEHCFLKSPPVLNNARSIMDHDEDDTDLVNAPLVGKHPSSNPGEETAAVREPRRWDFFVLTVPFFGCVCQRDQRSTSRIRLTRHEP